MKESHLKTNSCFGKSGIRLITLSAASVGWVQTRKLKRGMPLQYTNTERQDILYGGGFKGGALSIVIVSFWCIP